jgi:peptidoglycan/LPS O-acetylase OafA/YrhL
MNDPNRVDRIDVLRGLAIAAVALFHAVGASTGWDLPWNGWVRDTTPLGLPRTLGLHLVLQGWIGVPLFFVLSGFCIHYGFLRSIRPFDPADFFRRRFWRIYPAYAVALLTAVAYQIRSNVLNLSVPADQWQVLSHLLLIQNLTPSTLYGIVSAFWSIAVEFQLYLLYPLLLRLRSRFGIANTLAVTAVLSLIAKAFLIGTDGLPDRIEPVGVQGLISHWFDWTLGAWVAERFITGKRVFQYPTASAWGWLAAAFLSTWFKPLVVLSFSLFTIGFAALLEALLQKPTPRTLPTHFLSFIGLISYSLYLWHQPLQTRLHALFNRGVPSPAAWFLGTLTLIAIGWLLYRLIEVPATRHGRRPTA